LNAEEEAASAVRALPVAKVQELPAAPRVAAVAAPGPIPRLLAAARLGSTTELRPLVTSLCLIVCGEIRRRRRSWLSSLTLGI